MLKLVHHYMLFNTLTQSKPISKYGRSNTLIYNCDLKTINCTVETVVIPFVTKIIILDIIRLLKDNTQELLKRVICFH